ncbi:hypothetical protein QJS04_geneDACA005457 [Acorus gramineus]|uniref:Uncharacterized protein n=1 Tax=Acorus gramineus TaxID=55184 RepID=A0AAV9A573_ACOGR|nr:hypothetical protein QJS04_geneDACA005457 [Acorus gramineus]
MNRNLRILLSKSLSQNPLKRSPKPIPPIPHETPKTPSKSNLFSTVPTSKPSNPPTHLAFRGSHHSFSTGGSPSAADDHDKAVDEINLKFAEAREEIETAMESKETVYFDEESEIARSAVKEVIDMWEALLGRLSEKERSAVQRSMGLKIEQLKAELKQLDE